MKKGNKRLEKLDRFLKHMINRLNQKLNLVASTKEEMIKFFTENISGDVKVEFTAELPTEGDFEYAEYLVKDYCNVTHIVNFAYANIEDLRYSGVLYVVIRCLPIKEYKVLYDISDVDTCQEAKEVILNCIFERIKVYMRQNHISFDEKVRTSVEEFLSPYVDGKVWVVTDAKVPKIEGYVQHEIVFEKEIMQLAYVKGFSRGEFPNFLFVKIEKKTREREFKEFCSMHYVPNNIVDLAIPVLNFEKKVVVSVCETSGFWRDKYKNAQDPIVIGQEYDTKTGCFRTTRPIGYVSNNQLVVLIPNEYLYCSEMSYIFE